MAELTNILHVEDDPDIREIASIALGNIGGYTVVQCSSGPAALSKAPEFVPDLLLFDVMMPEMTGPETLTELRKLKGYENVPAIFMTAKAQPEEVEAYKKQGAIAVIIKPFDVMTLAGEVRGHWEKAIREAKPNVIPFLQKPGKSDARTNNDTPKTAGG